MGDKAALGIAKNTETFAGLVLLIGLREILIESVPLTMHGSQKIESENARKTANGKRPISIRNVPSRQSGAQPR